MLNRTICKRCIGRHTARGGRWEGLDDWEWSYKRSVICPVRREDQGGVALGTTSNRHMTGKATSVCDPPPSWCPFDVEHVVAGRPNVLARLVERFAR